MFADDYIGPTAFVASNTQYIPVTVDIFSQASKSYGRQVDLKKTEVMIQCTSRPVV